MRGDWFAIMFLVVLGIFSTRVFYQDVFFPTHDLEYHIIRLWQFDTVFRSGVLFPRWAPDLNQGYGVPLFTYFYPLSNYIGETFRLIGFSYIRAVYLTVALGFVVSGFSFYWFIRHWVRALPALAGATLYMLAPYHLLDVYVRGSTGEVWSLALIPLVLGFIDESTREIFRTKLLFPVSISLSLLLLSHSLLGIIFLALALTYAWYRKNLTFIGIATLCGIALCGFYIIPLLSELSYVSGLSIIQASDHLITWYQLILPSWDTGFSVPGIGDSLSFQIGIVHLFAFVLSIFYFIKTRNSQYLFWLSITGLALFMMLEQSKFIWETVAVVNYMQFPWRLLAIVILSISVLGSIVAERRSRWFSIGLIVFSLICYGSYTYPVTYALRSDSFYLDNPDWTSGTATLGNTFTTIWLATASDSVKDATTYVRTNTAYFPGWHAYTEENVEIPIHNDQGFIALERSRVKSDIVLQLEHTTPQWVGVLVSLVSATTLCILHLKHHH